VTNSTSGGADIVQTPQGRVISVIDANETATSWRNVRRRETPSTRPPWQPFPGGTHQGPRATRGWPPAPRGTYLPELAHDPRSSAATRVGGRFVIRSFDSKKIRWRGPVSAAA